MTVIWAFLRTPLGRWLAIGLGALALAGLLAFWHGRAVSNLVEATRTEAINARDEFWRGKLKATEDAARDTIRRREAAAYQRAMEDEAKRQAADAAEAEKAATIVERVIRVSSSARDCAFDQATADALNELRGSEE